MSNDALLWNAPPPPPPRKPKPGERIWTMRNGGRQIDCELQGHGEFGWECQFFDDATFVYGRRWNLRASALDEAQEKRRELEWQGWESA